MIDRGKLRIDLPPGVEEGVKPSCGAVSGAEPCLQGLGGVRHSYTATQLLCYTATQLHSYTATQLHCYTMDETEPSPRTIDEVEPVPEYNKYFERKQGVEFVEFQQIRVPCCVVPPDYGDVDTLPSSNGLHAVKSVVEQLGPPETLDLPVNPVHHGWVRTRKPVYAAAPMCGPPQHLERFQKQD